MAEVNVAALKKAGFSPAEIIEYTRALNGGSQSASKDVGGEPVKPSGPSMDVGSQAKLDMLAKELGVPFTNKFGVFVQTKKGAAKNYTGFTSREGGFGSSKLFVKIAGQSSAMDLERAIEAKAACQGELDKLLEAHDVAEELMNFLDAAIVKLNPTPGK